MLSVLVVLHVRVGVCVCCLSCMRACVHACMRACVLVLCAFACVFRVCVCRACIDQRSIGVVSGTGHHIAEWCREALREALRELSGRLSGLERATRHDSSKHSGLNGLHGTILRSIRVERAARHDSSKHSR